jgi:hypothetical protein
VRVAQPGEQPGDPVEPEHVRARSVREKPVELRLDGGVAGRRTVGHDPSLRRPFCDRA